MKQKKDSDVRNFKLLIAQIKLMERNFCELQLWLGVATPATSNSKSLPWLCSPLSRMSERHRVTTKDKGGGYNLIVEAKRRPPVDPTSGEGGGEGKELVRSIAVRGRKEEDF